MNTIEKLLEYQTVDKNLFDIEKKLSGSEARKNGKQAQAFLRSVTETLAGIEGKAQELCNSYEKIYAELAELKENNAEFDSIANKVDDEKEIAYLKGKADELYKSLSELYSKAAKIKAEMLELAAQYSKLSRETSVNKEKYKKYSEEYAALKKEVEPEKLKIEEQLAALEKDIPPVLLEKYKEKRRDNIFPIVYKVTDKKYCGACGTELSSLQLDKLEGDGKFVECEHCRRIIFK